MADKKEDDKEFKWGEAVEFRMADYLPYDPAIYLCPHPIIGPSVSSGHILFIDHLNGFTFICKDIRTFNLMIMKTETLPGIY